MLILRFSCRERHSPAPLEKMKKSLERGREWSLRSSLRRIECFSVRVRERAFINQSFSGDHYFLLDTNNVGIVLEGVAASSLVLRAKG